MLPTLIVKRYSPFVRGVYGILCALSLFVVLSVCLAGGLCENHLRAAYAMTTAMAHALLYPAGWIPLIFVAFVVFVSTKRLSVSEARTWIGVLAILALPAASYGLMLALCP